MTGPAASATFRILRRHVGEEMTDRLKLDDLLTEPTDTNPVAGQLRVRPADLSGLRALVVYRATDAGSTSAA